MSKKARLVFYVSPAHAAWFAAQNEGTTQCVARVLDAYIAAEQGRPPLLTMLDRIATALESGTITRADVVAHAEAQPENVWLLDAVKNQTFD